MIFRSKYKYPIKKWKKRFSGETVFILGNGPSLSDCNLSLIRRNFVIGINRSYRVFIPSILIWQDDSMYEDCFSDLLYLPCVKITRKEIDPQDRFTHFQVKHGPFLFGDDPSILHGGGSTAALAVQLSVAMGFSKIVLLGCDASYRGENTDFYGKNKNHTVNTLRNFYQAMDWVKKECPAIIVNCGDAKQWKKVSLQEAISFCNPGKFSKIEWLNRLM